MQTDVIDIETVPDPEGLARMLANEPEFTAPSGWKDPDKIARSIAEQRAAWISKVTDRAALSPMTGMVVAVGVWGVEEGTGEVLVGGNEKRLLAFLSDRVRDRVVSFNGRSYDLPFVRVRKLRHGVHIPPALRPESRYAMRRHVDLRELLTDFDQRATGTLSDWCWLMGVEPPIKHTHQDIRRAHEAGDHDRIAEILRSDLRATADLWRVVEGLAP